LYEYIHSKTLEQTDYHELDSSQPPLYRVINKGERSGAETIFGQGEGGKTGNAKLM